MLFKKTHPDTNVSGEIFAANDRTCYGVILSYNHINAINFYGVANAIKPITYWEKFYAEKIKRFEANHKGCKVLLSAGGIKLFYIFITIEGDISDITDEEVKTAFDLSLIERR